MLISNNTSLRSQGEIITSWGNSQEIMVSIVCTTYNHECYIEDAIKSFLMQETSFAIEIIIHDDASTDKTVEIIKRYENQYPILIRSIIQTHNQHSLGGFRPILYAAAKAKGKFIALCEADDYWVDTQKTQIQYDVLTSELKPSLCFHSAIKLDMASLQEKQISKHYSKDQICPLKDIITGGGNFIPTASLMFKNTRLNDLQKIIKNAPVGDYFIQVYMSNLANAFYINKSMSVYRVNTLNTWSSKHAVNTDTLIKHKITMILAIEGFAKNLNTDANNRYFMEIISIYFLQCIRDSKGVCMKVKSLQLIFKTIVNLKWFNKAHLIGVFITTIFLIFLRNPFTVISELINGKK